MNLLVVGAGSMGRWFARATREAVDSVAFADRDPDAARAAADAVDGRAVPAPPAEPFDVVCVAVPIPDVAATVGTYADLADRAVVDVTGAMEPAVAAMADHAPDAERVSFHPLFAPEREPGNVAVVVDDPGPVTDELRAALAGRGNDLFETTAEEHDAAMSSVQGAAHAAVLAYGLASSKVREEFHTPVSRPLADLVERVTGGNPRVYADVQGAFDGAADVAAAADRLADADTAEFADLFEAAAVRFRVGASEADQDGGGEDGPDGTIDEDGDPPGDRR
jgi:prephenate dehydrogenase